MILAAAKLNPTTEAYFRTGLADRRYNEAESLLLAKQDAAALETFLQEIRDTEKSIASVSNVQKKEELKTNLIAKIDEYQSRLTNIETQVAQQSTVATAQEIPQTNQPQQSVSTQQSATGQVAAPQIPVQRPTVVQQPIVVTSTQTTPSVVVSAPATAPVNIGVAINNAKDELEKIKEKAKKEKEHEVNNFKKEDNKEKEDEKSEKKGKREDFSPIDKDRN